MRNDNTTINYIDRIAIEISMAAGESVGLDPPLYRLYAVLLLAKGEKVTDEDVHNAWSAWAAEYDPNHRSLVPFDTLPQFVQEMDGPYTAAIHQVARQLELL